MATLLSVNVGRPRDVAWNGRVVRTGIWKEPVHGPVMARRLNLEGDGQGDLAGHGGEQRAVMVYQAESYDFWRQFLGRTDLTWGAFGENFTVAGLPDDQVCIGDRYRIGEAEFEVTQPRTTCYRVGVRLDEPRMAALLVAEHRPGFYLRVLREGHVQSGSEIVKVGAATEQISVARVGRAAVPARRRRRDDAATADRWRRSAPVGAVRSMTLSPGPTIPTVTRRPHRSVRRGPDSGGCSSTGWFVRPTWSPPCTSGRGEPAALPTAVTGPVRDRSTGRPRHSRCRTQLFVVGGRRRTTTGSV